LPLPPQAQVDKAIDILLSTKPGVVADLIIANLAWLPAQRPADEAPGLRSGVEVLAEILTRRQQAPPAAAPKPQQAGPAAAPKGGTPPPPALQPPRKPQPPAGPPPAAPRPVRKQHASWPPPLEAEEARDLRLAAVKRVLAARHVTAPNFRELLLARLATKVSGAAGAGAGAGTGLAGCLDVAKPASRVVLLMVLLMACTAWIRSRAGRPLPCCSAGAPAPAAASNAAVVPGGRRA
jgi:hypothetical protein